MAQDGPVQESTPQTNQAEQPPLETSDVAQPLDHEDRRRHVENAKIGTYAEPPCGPCAPAGSTSIRGTDPEEWIDPLIGLGIRVDLLKDLSFNARGDVGSFAIVSDLARKAWLPLSYNLRKGFSIAGVCPWFDIDCDNAESGSKKIAFDGHFRDPIPDPAYRL